ncbi:MAG: ATP-binding protein [Defluviitaleaceae bacterium]|nr:ATP-binding protein [Defluviitaleaceae bacterium]
MFLCQMSGIPGTGKSTLARHICKLTSAVLLDVDTIKSSVMISFGDDIDFKFVSKISYDVIFALAEDNLKAGNSVVIDSPCSYEIILERGTNLAKRHRADYKFVECHLEDLIELNNRRTAREILPSQAYNTPIDESQYQQSIKDLKRPADGNYLLIDTSQGVEHYIKNVIEYLYGRFS